VLSRLQEIRTKPFFLIELQKPALLPGANLAGALQFFCEKPQLNSGNAV
jgi:hypothetical protein